MASLQNEQIDQSYQGLIKTANNLGAAPFPPAKLQYGNGTELPITIGDGTSIGIGDIVTIASGTRNIDLNSNNLAINGVTGIDAQGGTATVINGTYNFGLGFPGAPATNVDFTNATVTGLPGGAAGLENGTGTSSLQSAASLTVTAANASGLNAIALGEGATASSEGGVAIGESTTADGIDSVAIGRGANSNGESVAIGDGSTNAVQRSIAIGRSATANQNGIAIGNFAQNTGVRSISMASCAVNTQTNAADDSIMIVPGSYGTRLDATADRSIIIGGASTDLTRGTGADGIVIGFDAQQSASDAIAIGKGSNVQSTLGIAIGSNASTGTFGEAAAFGLDASATGNAGALALGRNTTASGLNPTAVGRNANASNNALAVGYNTVATGSESVALGYSADATAGSSVALGDRALANLAESVAIGSQVTSLWASGTTVNQFAIANYANINYADDTAAAAGGVPLGGVYHTSGALKIRIA